MDNHIDTFGPRAPHSSGGRTGSFSRIRPPSCGSVARTPVPFSGADRLERPYGTPKLCCAARHSRGSFRQASACSIPRAHAPAALRHRNASKGIQSLVVWLESKYCRDRSIYTQSVAPVFEVSVSGSDAVISAFGVSPPLGSGVSKKYWDFPPTVSPKPKMSPRSLMAAASAER